MNMVSSSMLVKEIVHLAILGSMTEGYSGIRTHRHSQWTPGTILYSSIFLNNCSNKSPWSYRGWCRKCAMQWFESQRYLPLGHGPTNVLCAYSVPLSLRGHGGRPLWDLGSQHWISPRCSWSFWPPRCRTFVPIALATFCRHFSRTSWLQCSQCS